MSPPINFFIQIELFNSFIQKTCVSLNYLIYFEIFQNLCLVFMILYVPFNIVFHSNKQFYSFIQKNLCFPNLFNLI